MKIKRLSINNFLSYKQLDVDFDELSLTNISGPTGAGKSAILDAICWLIYGKTNRNIKANEVLSWGNSEDDFCTGYIQIEYGSKTMVITRGRGGAKNNDLHFIYGDTKLFNNSGVLGLDITRKANMEDTQKAIELELGCSFQTFTLGSYVCKNSLSVNFFSLSSSDRAKIFSSLCDLSYFTELREGLKSKHRDTETSIAAHFQTLKLNSVSHKRYEEELTFLKNKSSEFTTQFYEEQKNKWELDHIKDIDYYNKQILDISGTIIADQESLWQLTKKQADYQYNIENIKEEIHHLESSKLNCKTCNQHLPEIAEKIKLKKEQHAEYRVKEQGLFSKIQTRTGNINALEKQRTAAMEKLGDLQCDINPYATQLDNLITLGEENKSRLSHLTNEIAAIQLQDEKSNIDINNHVVNRDRMEKLLEAIAELYDAQLDNNLVLMVQDTNHVLSNVLHLPLSLQFNFNDKNKLEVSLFMSGEECSFAQLSKGQQQLLQLSFCLAIMKSVSDNSGIRFENLFFDECLDGLDDEYKEKAFNIFSTVATSHSNVIVIDHGSAFNAMFTSTLAVSVVDGYSQIEKK